MTSRKALTAYEELLSRKRHKFSSAETHPTPISHSENVSATSISDKGEEQHLAPSYSLMSPRVSRGTTAEKKMSTIDKLLLEYETNFGNILNTAENILSASGLHPRSGIETSSVSYQSSLIGARQSKIEYNQSHSHLSRDDDKLMFGSLRQSAGARGVGGVGGDSESGIRTSIEEGNPGSDVSMFLERYSDRLVTLVAEKMLAASSSSSQK